jgi:hypothetical protein
MSALDGDARCATEEVVFFQLGVILLSLLPREAQAREADHPPEGSGFCGVLALTTRTAGRVRGGRGTGAKRRDMYTQGNPDLRVGRLQRRLRGPGRLSLGGRLEARARSC